MLEPLFNMALRFIEDTNRPQYTPDEELAIRQYFNRVYREYKDATQENPS